MGFVRIVGEFENIKKIFRWLIENLGLNWWIVYRKISKLRKLVLILREIKSGSKGKIIRV